jgi:hypothetical protein
MSKSLIYLFLFIGGLVGSYVPLLWGGSLLSASSVLLSACGGCFGIYIGYRLSQSL